MEYLRTSGVLRRLWLAGLLPLLTGAGLVRAAETNYGELAMAAWKRGEHTNALEIVTRGLTVEPKDARLWNMRAHMRGLLRDREAALADLTEAIRLSPQSAILWNERAKLRFQLNRMAESVADFDRSVRLSPESEPYNWQRGIALYYAGYFTDGRRQFESHQSVNSKDVENAAWHFLCVARSKGIDEARKNLIPIEGDARVPMGEIHRLFAGKATPEDVLAAAEKTPDSPRELPLQRFYAHLYLGLYYEALGQGLKVREHINAAAQLADHADYMGDVARVHAQRLKAADEAPPAPKPAKPTTP